MKAKPGSLQVPIYPRYLDIKIPVGWGISDLRSVSTKIADIDHKMPKKTNMGIKFIAAKNLNGNGINFKNTEFISKNDYLHHSKKFNAEKNDILISRIGSIGIARIIFTDELFIASYSVALIKPKKDVNSKFLQYYLNSHLPQKIMRAYTIVSGNVNLVLSQLGKVIVLLPPFYNQQKIASILSNVDSLIMKYTDSIESTEKLKKGLLLQLLTKGNAHKKFKKELLGGQIKIEIPEKWEIRKFGELITNTRLGTSQVGVVDGLGIPLLKMGNLTYGGFNYKKLEKIQISDVKNIEKYMLKENDFLFNTRNTDVLVGKCAVWKNDFSQAIFNNNLMRIEFSKSIENSNYVSYFLNSNLGRRSLRRLVDATTSVAAIYFGSLKLLKFPLPTLYEQQKITSILSTMDSKISKLESKKSNLEKLKKGLMQKLLSGQIHVKV